MKMFMSNYVISIFIIKVLNKSLWLIMIIAHYSNFILIKNAASILKLKIGYLKFLIW